MRYNGCSFHIKFCWLGLPKKKPAQKFWVQCQKIKCPPPTGPPQSPKWLDYIPPYIINGRPHADLMKIIPVCLDWAKVWLPLLWSQRVCINTWLHAKGLSQTSFWKFSSLPRNPFFSMMVANSLVSARGSAETRHRLRDSFVTLLFSQTTFLPCLSVLARAPDGQLCCRALQHRCLDVHVQHWAPNTPRLLPLC